MVMFECESTERGRVIHARFKQQFESTSRDIFPFTSPQRQKQKRVWETKKNPISQFLFFCCCRPHRERVAIVIKKKCVKLLSFFFFLLFSVPSYNCP